MPLYKRQFPVWYEKAWTGVDKALNDDEDEKME